MFGLFHKVLGAVYMMWGLANQGFKDFGKFLSHTIGDRSTARYYRPQWSIRLVDLGEAIELGGTWPVGYMDL